MKLPLGAVLLVALASACSEDDDPAPRDEGVLRDDAGLDASSGGDAAPSRDDASANGSADASGEMSRDASTRDANAADAGNEAAKLPPLNGGLDYQLGGAYAPDSKVTIVSRDREDAPAPGLYNICYVNGFQTQPHEKAFWTGERADLLLRNSGGQAVIDPGWPDEMILDIRTPEKRTRLAAIVGGWIEQCAADGFDAVEIDNLDTYSRQSSLPAAQRSTQQHAVAFIRLLADVAHAHGMAIGQKNSSELVSRRSEMGTDFVVAEQCQQYKECQDYKAGYGDHVLVIEYERAAFDAACKAFPELSIVLRDVSVTPKGRPGYVFDGC